MTKNKFSITTQQWVYLLISIIVVSVCISKANAIYSLCLLPFVFSVFLNKWSWKQCLFLLTAISGFAILNSLINFPLTLGWINKILTQQTNFYYVRWLAINRISYLYPNNEASFIKLLILNYKDQNVWDIYKQINNLSIGFMFVVSGYHINLLLNLLTFIFFLRRKKKVKKVVSLIFGVIYGYFLGFSIGIIRIILNITLNLLFKVKDNLKINAVSGCMIAFLFIKESSNYGFIMTFVCSIFINLLVGKIKNKLFFAIIINFGCLLLTLPLVLSISNKINIFAIFLNYLYSPLIPLLFFWLLITCWISPLSTTNIWIIDNILHLIRINNYISNYLYIRNAGSLVFSIYYFATNFGLVFYFNKLKNQENKLFLYKK